MAIATLGVYLYARQWGEAIAISMAFSTIVVQQLLYSLSVRSHSLPLHRAGLFENNLLIAVILVTVALQVILTQTPLLNSIFHTTPLTLNQWLIAIIAASIPTIAVEAYKIVTSTMHNEEKL